MKRTYFLVCPVCEEPVLEYCKDVPPSTGTIIKGKDWKIVETGEEPLHGRLFSTRCSKCGSRLHFRSAFLKEVVDA